MPAVVKTQTVAIKTLKPHPRNYRDHPPDQLEHIIASIRNHGIYRNVVVSEDSFILAGHGVVEALTAMGETKVPIRRVAHNHDEPMALQILAGDNEISNLAYVDDRALTEMLRELNDLDLDDALLGTGFDEQQLANLLMVTRPGSEIADADAAAEWVGMPEYDEDAKEETFRLIVKFKTKAERDAFLKEKCEVKSLIEFKDCASVWYPPRERNDLKSVQFLEDAEELQEVALEAAADE